MLKMAGLLLWFAAAGGFGCSKAAALRRRVRLLRDWLAALDDLACGLRAFANERAALFGRFLESKHLVWQDGTQVTLCTRGLTASDTAVLQPFLQSFGWRDAAGEEQHIAQTAALLQKNLQSAEQAAAQKGKIFVTVGFCAGLGGCLLLG